MLDTLMIDEYFTRIDKGLDGNFVIEGPVHMGTGENEEEIGRIKWYSAKTGFIRVKLYKPVYYKYLIQYGIEEKHMVFKN